MDILKIKLKVFKYELTDLDNEVIEYLKVKVLNNINNFCNQNYLIDTIPKQLEDLFYNRVVGEFLEFKKLNNELESFKFSKVISKVKEGDVSYEYKKTQTREDIINNLISRYQNGDSNLLIRFRRLG